MAKLERCLQKRRKFNDDREKLTSLLNPMCDDETRLTNRSASESKCFFKLVGLFYSANTKIDKQVGKCNSNNVDIVLVAHGAITDPMIEASELLSHPNIHDVVLHCPWNCLLSARAAYGVTTRLMKPNHTRFSCKYIICCNPDKNHHQVRKLDRWNSVREAKNKHLNIPTIIVSPVELERDGAWKEVEFLKEKYSEPGTNRVVIVFTADREIKRSDKIPFCKVMAALSWALTFSRLKATIYLAACLGDKSQGRLNDNDKEYLDGQYPWAKDNTMMTCETVFPKKHNKLYKVMEAVFGSTE